MNRRLCLLLASAALSSALLFAPAPAQAAAVEGESVMFVPVGWVIHLSHEEVERIGTGVGIAAVVGGAFGVLPPHVAGAVVLSTALICAADQGRGVDVHASVLGIVVPTAR